MNNYRIDNLQYCNWSKKIFKINNEAKLDAVQVTIAYHENFDEVKKNIQVWNKHFKDNKDLIFHGKTSKDIEKARKFPEANKDELGRLLVGAALGPSSDLLTRAEMLIKSDVDAVVLDTAHVHAQGVIDSIVKLRSNFPDLQIIGGKQQERPLKHWLRPV